MKTNAEARKTVISCLTENFTDDGFNVNIWADKAQIHKRVHLNLMWYYWIDISPKEIIEKMRVTAALLAILAGRSKSCAAALTGFGGLQRINDAFSRQGITLEKTRKDLGNLPDAERLAAVCRKVWGERLAALPPECLAALQKFMEHHCRTKS